MKTKLSNIIRNVFFNAFNLKNAKKSSQEYLHDKTVVFEVVDPNPQPILNKNFDFFIEESIKK